MGKAKNRVKFTNFIKKKFGRIDVLYYNVGISFYIGQFLDMNERGYDKMCAVNMKSLFFIVKAT